MRSLLAVQASDCQGCVVLVGEELERRGILERVDVVLLGKVDGEGALEGILLSVVQLMQKAG